MLLFIASEVMFFFAFFWAYFHSSLPILNIVAGPWPNEGVEAIGAAGIPLLNTLLLITSSLTVTIAHHAILENEREKVIFWTGITAI